MRCVLSLFFFLLFAAFSSCSLANNRTEIIFKVLRFSYFTEQARFKDNVALEEAELLRALDYEGAEMRLIEFEPEVEEFDPKHLNPFIGYDVYKLTVISDKKLLELVGKISACPNYPFFGGVSFNLLEKIIEYAVKSNNVELMRKLLLKYEADCASECVSDIFYRLKSNKTLYLKAFSKLSDFQQHIAVLRVIDFTKKDNLTSLNDKFINGLSDKLKKSARKYNKLVMKYKQNPKQFW